MDIPFGEWLPDQPPLGLQGCTIASNVVPDANSYRPFDSLSVYSNSIGGTAKGAVYAIDAANNNYNYVGDSSQLYALVNQSFTVATRLVGGSYTINNEDFWEFVQWNNTVIAVNGFTDLPQIISTGAANFANFSVGVKAKHITTMRDFVVYGNINDSAINVYRVRWSAINNPASMTVDSATLADFQDLPSEGGPIQKIIGGEYGIVFQRRAIWRMLFVGSPLIFQFDRVHSKIGAYTPQSCANFQNLAFFLAEEGFYSFNGTELNPIGRDKVNQYFLNDIAIAYLHRVHTAIDPLNQLVMWAYPSSSSVGGNPDKLLCYSWAFNRWTLVEGLDIAYMMQTVSIGYTLEGLNAISTNLDTGIPASLDSTQWTGGQILLGAFNANKRLAYFNGSAMAATVETGEFQLFKEGRAMLTQVRPSVIGLSSSITTAVYIRNNLTESVSVGAVAGSPNGTGFVQCRISSRYFRIRLETSAGVNFTHLIGVQVDGVAAGVR